jgi:hypothetical protein
MIVSSKKFMTQLVESIGRMTAMCFEDGVKAHKEVTRDLGKMRDALWQIRDALWLIKGILEDAAKEPVQEDKPLADIFEDVDKTIKESTLFEDVPKKERKRRRLRPSPEMRQLGSWAKHYHRSIREFSWAMRKMGMPIRESEGSRNLQYAWLTPEEAEEINRLSTGITR